MGYTHYWRFRKGIGNGRYVDCKVKDIFNAEELFKESVELFNLCLKELNGKTRYPNWGENKFSEEIPMVLCGGDGENKPIINDMIVWFNGSEAREESCETCHISLNGSEGFDFCKTEREPYDTAVWICLLCFKYYFGENMKITSDGDDEEHRYADEVFHKVLKAR